MTNIEPGDEPKLVQLGDGFHVRQAVDNMAWIDMGEEILVVDALEQPELEKEVFEAIRRTTGDKPVRYVLNTHTHYDHIAFNAAFERRYGAEIVNQRSASIPAAGRWFEGTRRRALMAPMPGCHTKEDCIVWVPADRALFVGDIFGWGLIPLVVNLTNETASLLRKSYARLIDYGAAVVIPGHGPLCSTAELERWVEYFNWLRDVVSEAVAGGKSDAEIMREVAAPEDMKSWWRFLAWKHEDSLSKMVRAVRKGLLG